MMQLEFEVGDSWAAFAAIAYRLAFVVTIVGSYALTLFGIFWAMPGPGA